MISRFKPLILIVTCIFLFGCDAFNKPYVKTEKAVDKAGLNIAKQKALYEKSPAVIKKSGYYADTNPVELGTPRWLDRKVSFKAQNLQFSFMVNRLLRNTDASVSYEPDVAMDKVVSMNYNGNIKGALDNLGMQADYYYTMSGKHITWSNFETKAIDISFMPGSSDYLVGRETAVTTASRGDITTVSNLDDSQHSSLRGSLSVWKDLESTLNNLKSKDGTVTISESTTTVMVHDHPSNVRAMENYIKSLNKYMSRQVELKVRVLQVELNDTNQFGIDWNAAARIMGEDFRLSGNILNSVQAGTMATQNGLSSLTIGSDNSNAVINALNSQGKTSIITEPTVTTLNNQVAELRITKDTSYLEKAEQTMSNQGNTSTSITPGVVTDGFTLYILPKIQNDKIYLQVSSTLSVLDKIDSINNLGGINKQIQPTDLKTTGAGNGLDIVTIQIPTLSQKRFNIRSLLENNSTIIIGGFKSTTNRLQQTPLFGVKVLGGRASLQSNTETIILITPTIIIGNDD